jgi:hypothetical protein
MPDNTEDKGSQDRNRVAANQDWEIDYMVTKFNVTRQEIREAIKEVGNDRDAVEEYFRKKSK